MNIIILCVEQYYNVVICQCEFQYFVEMVSSGKLLLCVLIGVLVLLYGIVKLKIGVGFVMGMLVQQGLLLELVYFVYVGEVVVLVMMIVGIWIWLVVLFVVINMIVVVVLVYVLQLFQFNDQGGWVVELQVMYLFGVLVVMLFGVGCYSVGGVLGCWN